MIVNRINRHPLPITLNEVNRLSYQYMSDLQDYVNYSLPEFFEFVKNIPYKKDPDKIELILRPEKLLTRNAGDCDCKTVLCLACFRLKKIPCGFSVVSGKITKPYHHIFPFVIIDGYSIDFDATYNYNEMGNKRKWPRRLDYKIQDGNYVSYIRR